MTRFITIPPFVLPRFTWLVGLLLPVAPHPRQAENIASQRERQAAYEWKAIKRLHGANCAGLFGI
jgi:hypothetical protein